MTVSSEVVNRRAAVSLELNSYLKSTIDSEIVPQSLRAKYSFAAFDLSIEHHYSIALLVSNKRDGSAYALLRPLIEAEIAGRWLSFCASDEQIEKVRVKGFCPKPEAMLKQLEKSIQTENRIQTMFAGDGRVLHDFTHSGIEQWERRIASSGKVEPSYSDREIQGVMAISDLFASLSALGIAFGCAKIEVVNQIIPRLNKMREEFDLQKDFVYPKKLLQVSKVSTHG